MAIKQNAVVILHKAMCSCVNVSSVMHMHRSEWSLHKKQVSLRFQRNIIAKWNSFCLIHKQLAS